METCRDYSSIVNSPPFTFLVGPGHTKLTIQRGLAQHVSKPLDELMNNGTSRESKHGIAILEDEDVETFVAFCEYAYTGEYRVPPHEDREEMQSSNPWKGMFRTDSMSSAVPPPAPTPPRSVGIPDKEESKPVEDVKPEEEEEKPAVEVEETAGGSDEVAAAPTEEPQESSTAEEAEQPPVASAVAAAAGDEEADPWNFNAEGSTPKGKKGKKGKKDKKDKKGKSSGGASLEDLASNLTPPSTPPPEKPHDFETLPVETAADSGESAIPAAMTESWEQASPTPPEVETAWPEEQPETRPEQVEEQEPVAAKEEEKKKEKKKEEEDLVVEEPVKEPVKEHVKPFINTSFMQQQQPFSPRQKGVSLWDEFSSLEYVDQRPSYACHFQNPPSIQSTSDLPYLVFHAKLYVFATKYLIPALAQLCLRKLHADLLYLAFPGAPADGQDEEQVALTASKARMVLDLLHYTYTKTTRLEPISPTSATQLRDNELRKLVVHYAACKIRDLAEYCPSLESVLGSPSVRPADGKQDGGNVGFASNKGLRGLLDTTTELASDLVYRMM